MSEPVKDGTNEAPAAKPKLAAVRAKTENARKGVADAYSKAREKAATGYDTARDKTAAAYTTARRRASDGRERAAHALEENPVAALVGGLALGALVGALLPRGRREAEILSGVGTKINQTSRRVADAARDSARDVIDEYGLNTDSATDKVNSLLDTAAKAASSIGSAARGALKER